MLFSLLVVHVLLCILQYALGQELQLEPAVLWQLPQCSTVTGPSGATATCCPISSNLKLLPGPAAELPGVSTLTGPGLCDGCSGDSSFSTGPPATNPQVNLSSLASAFIIPSNGSVLLCGLHLTNALLPVTSSQLPAASLLALSAFGLSRPGAQLRLEDLLITTPSCAALSQHQAFACAASPSPNFTVTPTSLTVHRFSTPTTHITNVTLTCSGAPAPFPCVAYVASTGQQIVEAFKAGEDQDVSGLPTFVYLSTSASLAGAKAAWGTIILSFPSVLLSGPSDGSVALDLSDSTDLFEIRRPAHVTITSLTLTNPPVGPVAEYPNAALRVPLWTFRFRRNSLGVKFTLLAVRESVVRLPRQELALLLADALSNALDGGGSLPAWLDGSLCMQHSTMFTDRTAVEVPGERALLLPLYRTRSSLMALENVTAVPQSQQEEEPRPPCGVYGLGPGGLTAGSADGLVDTSPVCVAPAPLLCQLAPEGVPVAVRQMFNIVGFVLRSLLPGQLSNSVSSAGTSPSRMAGIVLMADAVLDTRSGGLTPSFQDRRAALELPTIIFGNPLAARLFDFAGLPARLAVLDPNGSLTLRHVILTGLPPAGTFTVALSSSSADATHATARRSQLGTTARRALLQQPPVEPAAPAPAAESATQGLPPTLANFTSCLWTLQFDRPAAAAAALGSPTAAPGNRSSPSLPHVFLDSVVLLAPAAEVRLLAWVLVRNSTAAAADPGLAGALAGMLAGSVAAGDVAGVAVALDSAEGAPASLTFARLAWCGLHGRNVTLTSRPPPAVTAAQAEAAALRAPAELELPVAYPAAPGGLGSPVGAGAAPDVGATASPVSPEQLGGPGGGEAPGGAPSPSPAREPMPALLAGNTPAPGSQGVSRLPSSRALAVALPSAVAFFILSAAVAAVMLWRSRKRRLAAGRAEGVAWSWPAVYAGGGDGSGGSGRRPTAACPADGTGKGGSVAAAAACSEPCKVPCMAAPAPASESEPARSLGSWTAPLTPSGRTSLVLSKPPGPMLAALHRTDGGAPSFTSSTDAIDAQSPCPSGPGSPVAAPTSDPALPVSLAARSDPRVGPLSSCSTASSMRRDAVRQAGDGMTLALAHMHLTIAAQQQSVAGGSQVLRDGHKAAAPPGNASAGPCVAVSVGSPLSPHGDAEDGGSGGLVVTGELGRGAQGVVYRGVWRGLDVAVKSVLIQGGPAQAPDGHPSPCTGGTDPRVSRAVTEAAISASVSHPNVVATYTYTLTPLGYQLDSRPCTRAEAASGSGCDRGSEPLPAEPAAGPAPGSAPLCEAEAWKLTLVQELCDANSLRRCLQAGLLAGCAALRRQRPRAPSLGGTLWEALLLPRPVRQTAAQPAVAAPDGSPERPCPTPSLPTPRLLARTLCPSAPPSPRVAVLVALQAARGLAYLHARGIVHGDVSSANVLLASEPRGAGAGAATQPPPSRWRLGPPAPASCPAQPEDDYTYGFVAKMCDFGLSGRLAEDDTHLSGPARRSSAYSAPELVRHGHAAAAGDSYALGVVMWELAHGSPLPALLASPAGSGVRSWLAAQAHAPPRQAGALPYSMLTWPECAPRGYVACACACLAEEPGARPGMGQVCDLLAAVLEEPRLDTQ